MQGPPPHFDLYAIGTGIVLAALVVAIGAIRLARAALAFKNRIEGYSTLPFAAALERTQRSVAIASRNADKAPALIARAQRAIADIDAARAGTMKSVALARDTVRTIFTTSAPRDRAG